MDLNTQKSLNTLLNLGAMAQGVKLSEDVVLDDAAKTPTRPAVLSGDALNDAVTKLRTQANPWMPTSEAVPLHLAVYVAIDDFPLHGSIIHSVARATRLLNDEDPAAPILWLDCGCYRGFIGRPEDRGGAKYLLPSARVIAWAPLPPDYTPAQEGTRNA